MVEIHTSASWGTSGAGMSLALGDIGLKKILPTAIRRVGMDLPIPELPVLQSIFNLNAVSNVYITFVYYVIAWCYE